MKHAYKLELQRNLEFYYIKNDWSIQTNFEDDLDEILLVIPYTEDIKLQYDSLYDNLRQLPDIGVPSERTVISFCYPDGSGYCFKVINPDSQDHIHIAILGQLPSRRLTKFDLREDYLAPSQTLL